MPRSGNLLLALTAAFSACTLAACGPAATFAPRGGSCPARPAGCSFALISGRTAERYEVVGVIDVEAFSAKAIPNDEASFRAAITDAVCRAGGDAVIAGINRDGRYVLATVVKWIDAEARTPVCPKPSKDAGTPKNATTDGGVAAPANNGDAGLNGDSSLPTVEPEKPDAGAAKTTLRPSTNERTYAALAVQAGDR